MKDEPPVNGDFVNEGIFLAVPVGFPGVSLPLEASASRLHRLCLSPDGQMIYAATRGPKPHLIQFAPKGTFGYAVDLGCLAEDSEIVALAARPGKFADELLVMLVGDWGTRLVHLPAAQLGHGIQEWHVVKTAAQGSGEFPEFFGVDLGLSPDGKNVALQGEGNCLLLDWTGKSPVLRREIAMPGKPGRIFTCANESFTWLEQDGRVGSLSWENGEIMETAPPSRSAKNRLTLIVPTFRGALCADVGGNVWEWLEAKRGFSLRGRIALGPVQAMTLLKDGRIFAFAGDSIAHWHVLGNTSGWARDLGVAVSTLSTRRYGFEFRDLLCGSDGEIYAAEDDHGGHLWMYFPSSPTVQGGQA